MDNETARDILSAYRHNGADARERAFLEALEQAERDPETKLWFRQQQALDRQISAAMRELTTPPDGKERLLTILELQSRQSARQPVWARFWQAGMGLAAALALLLGSLVYMSYQSSGSERIVANAESFSLSQMARNAMPLHFRDESTHTVVGWLAERGAPIPQFLPNAFQGVIANGCKVYTTGNGGVVSLLCFEVEGELLHMFVFDEKARTFLDLVPRQWWREGDWNLRAFDEGSQLVGLVSKVKTDIIDRMFSI